MGSLPPAAMAAPLLMLVTALWSLLPKNATLAWAWPWFPLWFIGLGILLPLAALALAASGSRVAAAGPEKMLRAGILLLLAAPLLACLNSPDAPRSVASAGGMALGLAAILCTLARPESRTWLEPGGKLAGAATLFSLVWSATSLHSYLFNERGPFQAEVNALDQLYGQGQATLAQLLGDVEQMGTATFGDANLAAGFALLLLPFPIARLMAGKPRTGPALSIAGLVGMLVAAESGLVPVAVGVGLTVGIMAHGDATRRIRLLLLAAAALAVFAVACVAWSDRLRSWLMLDLRYVFAENEGFLNQLSQFEAAWICGLRNFPAGAGEGFTPAIYESLRPELMGSVEGILNFHVTPAHLWAVFGLTGLAAAALVTASAWGFESKGRLAPHVAGLAAWAVICLGDYSLNQPGPVILLGLHLGTLAAASGKLSDSTRRPWISAALVALWMPFLAMFLVRHLPARIAIEDYFEHPADSAQAEELVALNQRLTPVDPYLPNTHAVRLMELHPLHPEAVSSLQASLEIISDQEFPHTWLGWLLLDAAPEQAATHFRASLRLNPRVPGLGEGLGLALLKSGKTQEAVRAFAAHSLQFPHFLLGDRWLSLELKPLEKPVMEATVAAADRLLAKPGLPAFLEPRLAFVRNLADARLKGHGETVLRGYLAPRNPRMRLFFEAWDHPDRRLALVSRALAARFRPDTSDPREVENLERQALGLTRLFEKANGEPLAFFLLPSRHFDPALKRTNFGVLQGHARSLSPVLPWHGPITLAESAFFGEFLTGLTGRDFDWVLGLPDTP